MRKVKAKSNNNHRFVAVAAVFCVACIAFLIVLAMRQAKGSSLPPKKSEIVRYYTVPGARGEIYDRNGKKIVGNSDSYDLVFEYGAMPDTREEVNASLLGIMDAIKRTGNEFKIADDLFILDGTYPNMTFVPEMEDKESSEYYHYTKFLTKHNFKEGEMTPSDIAEYFVSRYALGEYSAEQKTTLIRLYYEMERVDFGAYAVYTVARGVNDALVTAVKEAGIEGVTFDIPSERVYLYPGTASHILGRVGKMNEELWEKYEALGYGYSDYVGTSGCEAAFEEHLRGTDGELCVEYDKEGRIVREYYTKMPKRGKDVYLTIDIELQLATEKALAENVEMIKNMPNLNADADAGAITVLDPNTGKVLATASYPTYDLSKFESKEYYNSLVADENLPLYNRALQGVYAPGSTYKIGVALAALEGGYINKDTEYVCNHQYHTGQFCLHIHGSENVIGAIRDSCNIFFFNVGEAMGINLITDYTERLGLGADTGLELGDKNGIVAGPAYRDEIGGAAWMLGDDLSASIGQSDHGYTPLQLSVYIASVVNGGTRYNTHILDSVREFYTGNVISKTDTTVADKVEFSDETYDLLIESMRQVVDSNQDVKKYFKDVPVTVGGKTGTAEVDGKTDYAVFCGFAPLDTPEIVISCVIEEGKYGQYAAYAVGKIMETYFANYGEEIGERLQNAQ
ncbi:MAG: hypothetical protein E7607_07450 [Ruminococcaceae bacterium]|nr:hypothetical protein [Oscillospiraceae bacterium]